MGFVTAMFFENFPQYNAVLALGIAHITDMKAALSLSFLLVLSKYFLAASSKAFEIFYYTHTPKC